MGDTFVRNYIEELLRNVRTQVLLRAIRPYTHVSIAYLAKVSERTRRRRTRPTHGPHLCTSLCVCCCTYRVCVCVFVRLFRNSTLRRPKWSPCWCRSSWMGAWTD
jgi:hypothetical protein